MKKINSDKFINIESLLLIIGLGLLVIHYCFFFFTLNTQIIILLLAIFLIGVPHGALDFLVDEQNEIVAKQAFSINKFVVVYLSRLFAFALFWLYPVLAFSLFMICSIYHFGETDISTLTKTKKPSTAVFIIYGVFMLGVLLLTHLSEISSTLPMMDSFFKTNELYLFIEIYRNTIISLLTALFVATMIWQRHSKNMAFGFVEGIQFIFLLSILILLPLLLAFTFYFAFWHSILSVRNIFLYFKTFNNTKKISTFRNKTILFSLLALGGILLLYLVLSYFLPQMNLLLAILIMLSVLTLPHLSVMHKMYKNFGITN